MSSFLKGNFQTKKTVEVKDEKDSEQSGAEKLAEKFKKAALASIGGSMVYVEKTQFTWDPEEENNENKDKMLNPDKKNKE